MADPESPTSELANQQTRGEQEHRSVAGIHVKATTLYGWTGTALVPLISIDNGDGTGTLSVTGGGSGGGSATAALQTLGNTSLNSIDSKIVVGQTTKSASQSVTIASDQNAIPVSGTVTTTPSGTQDENIKQVNGVAINIGTGTAGTGTQRVAISSDSFPASQAVTGTFFQTTQPVSLATNTPDITDRSARLLGHVTVDNASIPVTGTFFQSTQPISVATLPQSTLPSTEINGQITGTTAGTAVQLPSNSLSIGVIVQALSTNTTSIYVGTSTVSSANGFELQPGQSTSVGVNNSSAVWIVSTTNGDKVCWIGS